jgi:hypothetical protein
MTYVHDPIPAAERERMNLNVKRLNAKKDAESILRDWDRINTWSTRLLMLDAQATLSRGNLDLLTQRQLIRLVCIASGLAERPFISLKEMDE